jgi:predicted RNA-binding protein with TRAM domain
MEERRGFGGRRGGFRARGEVRSFAPKPVQVGQEYDVDIQEMSRRGEGIARIQGLVIFVKNTKPNEHVKIRITRISTRFAEAEVVAQAEAETKETSEKEETGE